MPRKLSTKKANALAKTFLEFFEGQVDAVLLVLPKDVSLSVRRDVSPQGVALEITRSLPALVANIDEGRRKKANDRQKKD
jgi:hypothetical protein